MTLDDVVILDPCSSDEWMEFIIAHPDASAFHHPAWLRMLRDTYGYRVFSLCMRDARGISAGIPFADVRSFLTGRRWVSLPFSDHCQPLWSRDPSSVDMLLSSLKTKQQSETPRIEIRWNVPSSPSVYNESNFVVHTLHIGGETEASLFKKFSQQAQRSIRRAEKEGVVVKECPTYEDFEVFYQLQVKTRRRLGVPAQPREFFRGVWKHIVQTGLGRLLIAFKEHMPVGGGVFFKFNNTLFYKYGASDLAQKALQPNYAYMWSAIQRALEEGCTTVDFGRTDKENTGLRRFKLGWASTEHELTYTTLADRPPKSKHSRLDRFMGAVIRRSPEFVCELSGRLLYKHFA